MKKVLVVDDTKNIRMLLSTCLEHEGYAVITASDGMKALELFNSEKPDLAFLDIKMPEMSGTEVLKRIRDAGITTPVIIITAFATIKNAVECTKMGAVAYLQKPFTADKVRSVLNDISLCMEDTAKSAIEALISNKAYTEAIDLLKAALKNSPSNPDLYNLFATTYEALGDMENAKKFSEAYKIFSS